VSAFKPEPLPGQPRDDDGPVFREAWEAQAFAMALLLYERGVFTWQEWAAALSEEIARAQRAGDPDLGDTYYRHWLAALELLVVGKGLASDAALHATAHAWEDAARATPHGKPIELPGRGRAPNDATGKVGPP
jgi:nitrile hydratase accessory protein